MYFVSDRGMLEHYCPWDTYHIEVPERLETVLTTLKKSDISSRVKQLNPRLASEDEIEMVHTRNYISEIKRTVNMNENELEMFSSQYEDIYVNRQTFNAALLAAGCVFELIDAVTRTGDPGFAAVRPPGHHAFPDRGCGFCIFNNVALAAKHALKRGHSRVLIVDWDVHAGQGTQECIKDDDRIRLISIHRFQHGHFWPNLQQSAVETNFKNTVNVPLNEVGMSDSDFLAIFQLIVHPLINDFKPDIILVSCGFDAALGDPEGEMLLTPAGYATLTRQLMSWSIPVAMILEGGYFLDSIAADFEWVVRALKGETIPSLKIEPLCSALPPVINRVLKVYGPTYPTLALLEAIKQHLKPTFHENDGTTQEYEGTRSFAIPFPTRGLYSKMGNETMAIFAEQLQRITASYKERSHYEPVHCDMNANEEHIHITIGSCTTLTVSCEIQPIVHSLISQTINPLLPSSSFQPSLIYAGLGHLTEIIRNVCCIPKIPPPYITYL